MRDTPYPPTNSPWFTHQWPGLLVWLAGGLVILKLDGYVALSSLAMFLVLTCAAAAVWLHLVWNLIACLLSVVVFNWLLVPPRHTFAIDLQQDAVVLLVMCTVSMLVALLMAALRSHAWEAQRQAQAIAKSRDFGEVLRDAAQVLECLPRLQQLISGPGGVASVLALREGLPTEDDIEQAVLIGRVDALQLHGLWYCLRSGHTLGPGTGRYENLRESYLPLRGRGMHYGAALMSAPEPINVKVLAEAQTLCDMMGAALERQHSQQQQRRSDQNAQEQSLRATLLTAIAHDYRTPLATIMGAASSLEEQDSRLTPSQRQQLAHRIVAESTRLKQLTGNILQLARLDTPGLKLQCDWQAAEELVGSVVQRCAQSHRLQLELPGSLPLLWCDPLLVEQLLDNLIDNSCKYSTPGTPIHLVVHDSRDFIAFAVSDSGPGIPASLQHAIFQPFRQGEALAAGVDAVKRTGVGLGLALCRGIAVAHGGDLQLHALANGCCFEFRLPVKAQPSSPKQEATIGAQA